MDHKKINNEKMQQIADNLKIQLPGCGFALIAFDIEAGETLGNYVSNVNDEFMIKTLEQQIRILKERSEATSRQANSSQS
jgi:hypothetical protein